MVDGVLLGPLILFALAMSFTPGPNVVMATASAANFGFRPVIPLLFGIATGFGAMMIAVGLGLGKVAHAQPQLHTILKFAGAAYLVYLAWRIATASPQSKGTAHSKPIGFFGAALLQLLNPKGWASALGGVATYTTAEGSILAKTAVVSAVLVSTVFLSVTTWAAFGTAIGSYINEPRHRRVFNWFMAGLLVVSLIPVLW